MPSDIVSSALQPLSHYRERELLTINIGSQRTDTPHISLHHAAVPTVAGQTMYPSNFNGLICNPSHNRGHMVQGTCVAGEISQDVIYLKADVCTVDTLAANIGCFFFFNLLLTRTQL